MAPSAIPLTEDFNGKPNPKQDFEADVDRKIEDISSCLYKTVKHVLLPLKRINAA